MNVSVVASARPAFDTRSTRNGSHRGVGLRRDPHAARQGQEQRVAARDQAGRPRRRPDARDARSATSGSTPTASTTSCSAASRRSATRAPTSPRPPRSRPACRTRSPACSSTASAPPAWRPSTSPRRRSPPAGRTSSSPAASSRCRACRWAPTAAPGRWTPRPTTTPSFVPQGIGADLIATIEELQPRGRRRLRRPLAGARRRARRPTAASPTRSIPVKDLNEHVVLDHDEFIRPGTTVETLGEPQAVVRRRSARWAASTPSRCRSTTGSRRSTTSTRPATRPASSTAPRCVAIGNEQTGERARPDAARADPRHRASPAPTRRSCSPAPRPPRRKALAKAGLTVDDLDLVEINEAFAAVVLRFVTRHGPRHGEGQRQRRRDRDGPPARRDRRR